MTLPKKGRYRWYKKGVRFTFVVFTTMKTYHRQLFLNPLPIQSMYVLCVPTLATLVHLYLSTVRILDNKELFHASYGEHHYLCIIYSV